MTTLPAIRVVQHLSRGFMPVLGMFLALVVTIFLIIGTAVSAFGSAEASLWQIAGAGAFKYFPMSLTIVLTPVVVPTYVAHGVTRHQVIAASALITSLFAAIMAVAMWLGFAVEALIYRIGDWPQALDMPHLFGSWTNFPLIFAEYFLLIAATLVSGWLIGTTYYRLHWFWATILIPVALLPALAAELLLQTSWIGAALAGQGWSRPPLQIAIPAVLLVIGVGIAVNHILVRTVEVHAT